MRASSRFLITLETLPCNRCTVRSCYMHPIPTIGILPDSGQLSLSSCFLRRQAWTTVRLWSATVRPLHSCSRSTAECPIPQTLHKPNFRVTLVQRLGIQPLFGKVAAPEHPFSILQPATSRISAPANIYGFPCMSPEPHSQKKPGFARDQKTLSPCPKSRLRGRVP